MSAVTSSIVLMMTRSVSPLVPEFPVCPVSPVWPVARLCAQLCPSPHFAKLPAGPSLVRARQGSPAELCSFLSGRACKHDRPAHTALRLADTASQSQSSAPSDHIQHHIVNINSSAPVPATTAAVVIRSVLRLG